MFPFAPDDPIIISIKDKKLVIEAIT